MWRCRKPFIQWQRNSHFKPALLLTKRFLIRSYITVIILAIEGGVSFLWYTQDLIEQSVNLLNASKQQTNREPPHIARFMGPTWGPSGADRTQVGPMLAPRTLLSGTTYPILLGCTIQATYPPVYLSEHTRPVSLELKRKKHLKSCYIGPVYL